MPDAKAMLLTRRCRNTSMPGPSAASRTKTTVAASFGVTGVAGGSFGNGGTALAGTAIRQAAE